MTCRHGIWEPACVKCKPIHSSGDLQWNFTYPFKPGDQVNIHSKGHFVRECKKRGQVWTTREDLVSRGTPYHPGQKAVDTSEFQPALAQIVHEAKDVGRVNQKWNQLKAAGKVKEG